LKISSKSPLMIEVPASWRSTDPNDIIPTRTIRELRDLPLGTLAQIPDTVPTRALAEAGAEKRGVRLQQLESLAAGLLHALARIQSARIAQHGDVAIGGKTARPAQPACHLRDRDRPSGGIGLVEHNDREVGEVGGMPPPYTQPGVVMTAWTTFQPLWVFVLDMGWSRQ
jgi:hypothetical protein